jgi:hypothetical protein
MKKLTFLATCAVLLASSANANTFNFTVSDAFGTGNFGTVTTTDLGAKPGSTDTVSVSISMAPNFILDTGGHYPLTLSLLDGGRIDQASFNLVNGVSVYTAQPHDPAAGYDNDPFKGFTDAVAGSCGSGGSTGGCGSLLSFNVINFAGFAPATTLYNGQSVYGAVDILRANCTGACTGAVGLVGNPTPTPFAAVPGPLLGSGIPGLVAACLTMLGLNRSRRRRQTV